MAYAKKVSRRRYRSSRYRRRAWRRKYRRNRYRRRYRRARRNRPEYKRIEIQQKYKFSCGYHSSDFTTYFHVDPFSYDFFCIGAGPVNGYLDKTRQVNILQGANINNRIGAKIRPTALRLFGTMSIYNYAQTVPSSNLTGVNNVNGCMLRMIVFQVRNGNNDVHFMNSAFSAVNPYGVNVAAVGGTEYPINVYNTRDQTYYLSSSFFSRLFSVGNLYTIQNSRENNITTVNEGVLEENLPYFGTYAKCPYRAGIGTYVKILKDKLYHLNPTIAPTFAFRTKTKRPYRMVWLENDQQENGLENNCKNPIYIVFIPIYPVGINGADIEINFNAQFYYTDK